MHPSQTDPRYQHAQQLIDQNNLAAAITFLKEQITQQPSYFQGWLQLSRCLFQAGFNKEAIHVAQKAEQIDPLAKEFQAIQIAMQQRNIAVAESLAREMLKKELGHPRAIFTLAQIAEQTQNDELLLNILNQGIAHSPANVFLRQLMISAYEAVGNYKAAIDEARNLVSLSETPESLWQLINVLLRYDQNEEAIKACDKATAICAGNAAQLSELALIKGQAQRILGQRSSSINTLKDCLAFNPQNGFAWWAMADMKDHVFSEEEQQRMLSLLSQPNVPEEMKSPAEFALAKSFELQGKWDIAMRHYHSANQKRSIKNYSPDAVEKDIDSRINGFTPEVLRRQSQQKSTSPTPIFIVGLPRAGSTLLEQILASHSQIQGTLEQPTMASTARMAKAHCLQRNSADEYAGLAKLTEDELGYLGQTYLTNGELFRSLNGRDEPPYFTDKHPFNFRHAGLIHKILPEARIIDIRRNPMDCGFSLYKQYFTHGVEFSYDLTHIGQFYNQYLRMMDHWHQVLPGKILTIQYEDLVNQPEASIRKLLDYVGVDFEQACLNFHNTQRHVRTASSEQVRQPLHTRSIGAWKSVAEELKPLKESLGEAALQQFNRYL